MITATKPDPPRLFPPSPAYSPLPNFAFRVSNFAFLPLSPFPATLTRTQRFCRKTAPVSPFLATLTDTPSRKSFPCHSYKNMGGVPALVPASTSRRPRNPLTPLESALTDSSSRKSFRIRSYEKHRREWVPSARILNHHLNSRAGQRKKRAGCSGWLHGICDIVPIGGKIPEGKMPGFPAQVARFPVRGTGTQKTRPTNRGKARRYMGRRQKAWNEGWIFSPAGGGADCRTVAARGDAGKDRTERGARGGAGSVPDGGGNNDALRAGGAHSAAE